MYRILMVDDNEEFVKVQKLIFEVFGYYCDAAYDAKQAISMLKEKAYDLIISDYKMHGMKGIDLLEYIKANFPMTDFIMMTGNENDKDREKAMELGACDYILKGDDPQQLVDIVKKLNDNLIGDRSHT